MEGMARYSFDFLETNQIAAALDQRQAVLQRQAEDMPAGFERDCVLLALGHTNKARVTLAKQIESPEPDFEFIDHPADARWADS